MIIYSANLLVVQKIIVVIDNFDLHIFQFNILFSHDMIFPTMWYVRPVKASDQPAHMRSLIRAFASRLNIQLLLSY